MWISSRNEAGLLNSHLIYTPSDIGRYRHANVVYVADYGLTRVSRAAFTEKVTWLSSVTVSSARRASIRRVGASEWITQARLADQRESIRALINIRFIFSRLYVY